MHRDGQPVEAGTLDARGVLDFIAAHPDPAIFHLMDFHEPLRESAEIRRRLRDIYESCRDQRKFVVITSPVRYIPEEVERSLLFLELRPPDLVELVAFLREEGGDASDQVIHQLAPAPAGPDPRRSALRAAPRARRHRTPWSRIAAGPARREAAADQSQRRGRIHRRGRRSSGKSADWKV